MELTQALEQFQAADMTYYFISKQLGMVNATTGEQVEVDHSWVTTASVVSDAVFVPGGPKSAIALKSQGDALHFIKQAL